MATPSREPAGPRVSPWVLVLLAARFLLELALLAALAVGALSAVGGALGWLVAGALVLVAALVWGGFLSPRRRIRLPLPIRIVLELALFGTAASLLAVGGHATAAVLLLLGEVVVLAALGGPDRHADALG